MSFIHGYLLGGLLLAGLPILIHLIMRQKPRQLAFPAFRFLKRRASINRRRIRLQHLLLLALRMGLIALLCLAVARPLLQGGASSGNVEQPVAVVMLFDTSASMEYVVGGESRLKAAQRSAESLLDEMADGSRVAILDSGDDPGADAEWIGSLTQVRGRIRALTTRPASFAVNSHLHRAIQLLKAAAAEDKAPPCVLYVFSDRTRPSWSEAVKPEELPPGSRAVFVDVGVEEPHDVAIERVEVDPPIVEPGKPMNVFITVRATGAPHGDLQLVWQLDNDPDQEKQPVRKKFTLAAGAEQRFSFPDQKAPPLPANTRGWPYQITARLEPADALACNNSRSATFLVRNRPTLLMIADEGDQGAREGAALWKHAFAAIEKSARAKEFLRPVHETFACEIVSPTSVPESIKRYEVVCLFEVKKPAASLWDRLQAYVNGGGRLIVIPGGTEMDREQFNKNGEEVKLLPGTLEKLVDAPAEAKGGVFLQPVSGRHPFTKPFIEWNRAGQFEFNAPGRSTSFRRYWEVKPIEGRGLPIINFADKEQRPFLLENEVGSGGKVMMFATPFDDRKLENKLESWNNLLNMELGHGMVIFDQACWYLGGKSSLTSDVNFICGKPVQAPLLGGFTDKQYVLKGPPGLTLSETKIPPTEGRLLTVPQATHPGNYRVEGESGTVVAGFSVNIDSGEFNLARVPATDIEASLGEDAVLAQGTVPRLQDAVKGGRGRQIELLPWLMMAVLLILAVESVLANKFYKREAKTAEETTPARIPMRESARSTTVANS